LFENESVDALGLLKRARLVMRTAVSSWLAISAGDMGPECNRECVPGYEVAVELWPLDQYAVAVATLVSRANREQRLDVSRRRALDNRV